MSSVSLRDRLWLWLCAISLLCYMWRSESVRAFGREFGREFLQLVTRL
jgi:hypothetical protein